MKPYRDRQLTETSKVRVFKSNVDSGELQWHRDREDRIVEIIGETNWKVQLENNLPTSLNESIFIPKGEWHRLIKGDGILILKINKIND